jgi:hypothetical protein
MIRSIEKIHLIGTRTRDLPACNIVPQPTTLPCTHTPYYVTILSHFPYLTWMQEVILWCSAFVLLILTENRPYGKCILGTPGNFLETYNSLQYARVPLKTRTTSQYRPRLFSHCLIRLINWRIHSTLIFQMIPMLAPQNDDSLKTLASFTSWLLVRFFNFSSRKSFSESFTLSISRFLYFMACLKQFC